jgi:hypothetical protein
MMPEEVTRNASGGSGDDVDEMTRRPRLDDRSADALFSGRIPVGCEDHDDVAAFSEALRAAVSATPTPVPNAALTAVLADGLSTDNGDLPVTVGSNAPAPATQGSGLPKRRRKTKMLELLIAKLAGISLLAKTSVAGAAVIAASTGAGLTGNLPDQVQEPFDRAFAEAPAEPTEGDTTEDSPEAIEGDLELVDDELDGVDEVDEVDEGDEPQEGSRPEVPGDEGRATADANAGENGAEGRETATEAATDGRAFGERQATEARERGQTDRAEGQQAGQDAAASGRQNGTEASGDRARTGDDPAASPPNADDDAASDRQPVTPQTGAPGEVPAGSPVTGGTASDGAQQNAPTSPRP